MLDLVKKDSEYIIYKDDRPLLTTGGRLVSHTEQRLLKHIMTDCQLTGDTRPGTMTPLKLLEFQIDFLDNGIDPVAEKFSILTEMDEFIRLKTGRTRQSHQLYDIFSDDPPDFEKSLINVVFWGTSSIIINLNDFIDENIQMIENETDDEHPFILLLKQQYLVLKPEIRSAVNCLSFRHRSGIVLPLLLVLNRITASEYAKGLISIMITQNKESGILTQVYPSLTILNAIDRDSDPSEIYTTCLNETSIVLDFLAYINIIQEDRQQLAELLKQGESGKLEYKSTFRWDLKAGKTNPAVEHASLKTIAGFLNSTGGILLIGVRDDGSIEGIESDRFANEDKFLLHLWTLIRTSLGRDISPYIQTTLEKKEDKTVCIVRCLKSPQPVFLRQSGFNEEFFIRVGPSSNALDISEALRYIGLNFRNQVSG